MSYLSQLGALMWLQFVSAATGIAALAALARGLAGPAARQLLRRPAARRVPGAAAAWRSSWRSLMVLIGGMPMTFAGLGRARPRWKASQQTIARGPVAAFVAIKQLGTNGGGFFGPNSTQPFENPTFWTNALSR